MKNDNVKNNALEEFFELLSIAHAFSISDENFQRDGKIIEKSIKSDIGPNVDIVLKKMEEKIRVNIIKKSMGENYKSPSFDTVSEKYTIYQYERAMHPDLLEQSYKSKYSHSLKELIVFRSCLSAIDSLLKTISFLYENKEKINIGIYTSYFETKILFSKFYENRHYLMSYYNDEDELYSSLLNDAYPIFYIETIDLKKLEIIVHMNKIINAINHNHKMKAVILIFDITIGEECFEIEEIIGNITKYVLIFTVHSALKLEQLGLEIANLGVLCMYTNSKQVSINKIKEVLVSARSLSGTSILSYEEKVLLNRVFCKKNIAEYKKKIIRNTEEFYKNVCNIYRKEIQEIIWNELVPFIFLKLWKKEREAYNIFLSNIKMFLQNKGTDITLGTSFGFRQTRIEIIEKDNDLVIRISIGYYKGYNYFYLMQFLRGDYE